MQTITSKLFITGFLICCALLIDNFNVLGQQVESWNTHTSFNVVNDILIDNNEVVWGTTTGGIFKFGDNEFNLTLTTQDGLTDLDATIIANNSERSTIVAGYENGVIDIIDKKSNEVTTLDDIERADQFNPRSINDFAFVRDTMVVATDFGLVVYDLNTLLVSSTFNKLGSFNRSIPVSDIIIRNDTIYAGTPEGIAFGNFIESDLLIESNWQNFNQTNGLPSGLVLSMAFFNSEFYASVNESGNFIYDGSRWVQTNLLGNAPALEFAVTGDGQQLLALKEGNIFSVDISDETGRIILETGRPATSISVAKGNNDNFVVGTTAEGFLAFNDINSEPVQHKPEGPSINFVDGLTFKDGTLYAGTSRRFVFGSALNRFKTYNIFDGEDWKTFNRFNTEELREDPFGNGFRTTLADEFLYVGSWGSGILQQNIETDEIKIFNNSNSRLTGISNNQDFIVTPGIDVDTTGGIWATSFLSQNPLFYLPPDADDWIPFDKAAAVQPNDQYFDMLVDQNNQKWVALRTRQEDGTGLLVFDEGELEDPSDNRSIKLNREFNNGNLPDLAINDFTEDRNGEVWVATARGVARFLFADLILEPGAVQERRAQWLLNADTTADSPFLLRDIDATAITTNGANQKWIGTRNDGLWLVNAEGNTILEHFTAENSPLIDNSITSLTVDNESGRVYIGTSKGLVSFVGEPTEPEAQLGSLFIFPNPFSYEQNTGKIQIDQLSDATTISIITVDGTLVDRFNTRGGRVSWEPRTAKGEKLATGVYFIVAVDNNTDEKAVGKVLIVR